MSSGTGRRLSGPGIDAADLEFELLTEDVGLWEVASQFPEDRGRFSRRSTTSSGAASFAWYDCAAATAEARPVTSPFPDLADDATWAAPVA